MIIWTFQLSKLERLNSPTLEEQGTRPPQILHCTSSSQSSVLQHGQKLQLGAVAARPSLGSTTR